MLFHGSCMCLQSTQFLGKGKCRVSSQDCEDVSFNQRVVKQQYGITYLLHPALAEMGLVKAAKIEMKVASTCFLWSCLSEVLQHHQTTEAITSCYTLCIVQVM